MTNKELQKILKKYDDEAEIRLADGDLALENYLIGIEFEERVANDGAGSIGGPGTIHLFAYQLDIGNRYVLNNRYITQPLVKSESSYWPFTDGTFHFTKGGDVF